jgi:hypothetical protein
MLVEDDTHLSMMTVYDGDFDAYVEHFAIDVRCLTNNSNISRVHRGPDQ